MPPDILKIKESKERYQDMLKWTLQSKGANVTIDRRNTFEYEIGPEHPIQFYDRHLNERLVLKHVKITPLLVGFLSDLFDEEMRPFLDAGVKFPSDRQTVWDGKAFFPNSPHHPRIEAESIAEGYWRGFGESGVKLAAVLYSDDLRREVQIRRQGTSTYRPTFTIEQYLEMYPSDRRWDYYAPSERRGFSEDSVLPDIEELSNFAQQIAIWEFYPLCAKSERLIVGMKDVSNSFAWDYAAGAGVIGDEHKTDLQSPQAGDAADLPQSGFLCKFVAQSQDSCTNTEKAAARCGTELSAKKKDKRPLASLSAHPRKDEPYHPDPAHFLQHAWARAVLNDATFIMFSCGSYARVGIRDRASQTLFLSGLIKTATCTKPSYGKLNIGLHLAIFKDVLERQEQRFNAWKASNPVTVDAGTSAGRKRKREDEEDSTHRPSNSKSESFADSVISGHKHQKIEVEPTMETDRLSSLQKAISTELGRRNFALVNLNYGVFNSPAPSTFIRRGTSCIPGMYQEHFKAPDGTEKFTPQQAFSLTLPEPFDKGATSLVQRAAVEVQTESGEVLKHSLVVKLVFMDKENRPEEFIPRRVKTDEGRLLQEFKVYEHLARQGATERLVPVHGLFEDVDTGVLALIMEDGGISVYDSESHRTGKSITFSEKEGKMLIEAVEDIHAAGVFHGDIRLRNIVVDLKERAFLIDFDRAYILDDRRPFDGGPRERNIIEEMKCIEDIANGLETRDYFDYYV